MSEPFKPEDMNHVLKRISTKLAVLVKHESGPNWKESSNVLRQAMLHDKDFEGGLSPETNAAMQSFEQALNKVKDAGDREAVR